MDRKQRIRCLPVTDPLRMDRMDGGMDRKQRSRCLAGFVESKGAVAPPPIEPTEPIRIRRRIRKKDS